MPGAQDNPQVLSIGWGKDLAKRAKTTGRGYEFKYIWADLMYHHIPHFCSPSPPHRREALRVASTLLQAAGHLLITSASMIRRIIEGAELWQPQREGEYTANWN